jgi:hypothetical protein
MNDPGLHSESEVVDRIRSIDVCAPEQLHRQVQSIVAERSQAQRRRGPLATILARPAVAASLAGAVALVAAVAIAVGVGSGGSQQLTAARATALTLDPATAVAPAENRSDGEQLNASVEGTAFPYWKEHFGWASTGSRIDRVGGHTVRTVFYGNARGQRIGYAIVSGTAVRDAGGGSVSWRGRTPYRLTARGDVNVVTWRRNGHLCVMAGHGVSTATLLALASWDDRASAA